MLHQVELVYLLCNAVRDKGHKRSSNNSTYFFRFLLKSWIKASLHSALSLTAANPLITGDASLNASSFSQRAQKTRKHHFRQPMRTKHLNQFLAVHCAELFETTGTKECIWPDTRSFWQMIWGYFFYVLGYHQLLRVIGHSGDRRLLPIDTSDGYQSCLTSILLVAAEMVVCG